MNKTAISIVVVLIVLVGGWFAFKGSGTPSETGPIKIGFIAALSGDASVYGESTKGGMALAVQEINAAGGINGRQVEAIYEDGKCADKDAASAAQKLINVDQVKYIVGLPCSGEVLGVLPISEPKKVMLLVQGSSPNITGAGNYYVRVFPSDLFSSQTIAEHAISKNFKTIAIITETTDYAVAIEAALKVAYTKLGGTVVDSEKFTTGVKDFRTILTKIKTLKPDALFINAQTGGNAAAIAGQARTLGIQAQFYGAFFTGPEFVQANSAVNGSYVVDVPTLNSADPQAKEFLTAYKKFNGTETAYPFFSAGAYDETKLLAQALKQTGSDNTDTVRAYLHNLADYDGVLGNFHFDEHGDVVGVALRLVHVENNKVVPVN